MDLAPFNQKLDRLYAHLRANLKTKPRDYAWRMAQLKALKRLLEENDEQISAAMWADLHKPPFECTATEQGVVLSEIRDALKNLKCWMKPRRVSTPLFNQPGSCRILHDPLGLALIIGAWNYPVNLLLAPMVGAIAGGNAILLKPSELSVKTAEVLTALIPKYMDTDLIGIIQAGPEETSALLDRQFDHIFFTGSGGVGRIVMGKAARHLTPVVLELGGKSPAIVLKDANLETAARRLAWGKFMNSGQTCVAPDYILVEPDVRDELIKELEKQVKRFYGDNPRQSPDYCRIVNPKNFARLKGLIEPDKVIFGGETGENDLYIAPTLVESGFDDPIMKQEIFGPIWPIIEVPTLKEMIEFINSRDKPLALYIFSGSSEDQEEILERTSAGGVCVNDVVMHMPVASLPFGGVGASGMGHYHGKFSFEAFTHAKGVLKQTTLFDIPLRYAPYSKRKAKILSWLF